MRMIAKVCGLTRRADVACAQAAGADLLGFVDCADSPRHCADIASLVRGIESQAVLVIVHEDPAHILQRAVACGTLWVQPCIDAPRARMEAVAQLHARGHRVLLPWPDDPDQPHIAADLHVWEASRRQTGLHGGSGQPHALRFPPPGPYLLAGGLSADNVAARAHAIAPDLRRRLRGFDAASRLESAPGCKSPQAVSAFIETVHAPAL